MTGKHIDTRDDNETTTTTTHLVMAWKSRLGSVAAMVVTTVVTNIIHHGFKEVMFEK